MNKLLIIIIIIWTTRSRTSMQSGPTTTKYAESSTIRVLLKSYRVKISDDSKSIWVDSNSARPYEGLRERVRIAAKTKVQRVVTLTNIC